MLTPEGASGVSCWDSHSGTYILELILPILLTVVPGSKALQFDCVSNKHC